eukprot:UN16315
MRGYQKYMNPQTEDIKAKFNKTNFINSFTGGDSERGFYEEFLETQLFQCFVDDRFDADGGHVSEILILMKQYRRTSRVTNPHLFLPLKPGLTKKQYLFTKLFIFIHFRTEFKIQITSIFQNMALL